MAHIAATLSQGLKDPILQEYYQKIKTKKGANPAKVATARRLLTITYHILKENRPYEHHEFRQSPSLRSSEAA